jgi:hypothetical protein
LFGLFLRQKDNFRLVYENICHSEERRITIIEQFVWILRQNDKVKVNVIAICVQEKLESLLIEQLVWVLPASE